MKLPDNARLTAWLLTDDDEGQQLISCIDEIHNFHRAGLHLIEESLSNTMSDILCLYDEDNKDFFKNHVMGIFVEMTNFIYDPGYTAQFPEDGPVEEPYYYFDVEVVYAELYDKSEDEHNTTTHDTNTCNLIII